MDVNCQYIPYEQTGFFSKLFIDYLHGDEKLSPFYKHPVSIEGIKDAIKTRQAFNTNRTLLVDVLKAQYKEFTLTPAQQNNLDALADANTFTIVTAHQPNIFTGHLYFIYKILHTIKLAAHLSEQLPAYNFVPVFYMGSEDADLDELGHINLNGEKLEWKTKQTGAVGRMVVDKALLQLIDRIAGELEVQQFGSELIAMFRAAYTQGTTIQQATLHLVNALFANYGLLVLIPDDATLKSTFTTVLKEELTAQFSHPLVEETARHLGEHYKVQASGREINLFYLLDDHRERIEWNDGKYEVKLLGLQWKKEAMLAEVDNHPERFSPNVILRGVFQEMVLPNIAFIGGGGEIAYWLELQEVFEACKVPFPVLITRNSFLLLTKQQEERIKVLGFKATEFFKPLDHLIEILVRKNSALQLHLNGEKEQVLQLYATIKLHAAAVDVSLGDHIIALQKKATKALLEVEKKMLRAEKRKFAAQQRQIAKLKQDLFPGNSLQERVDNFAPFYATYGADWLEDLYKHSLTLEQQFTILTMEN